MQISTQLGATERAATAPASPPLAQETRPAVNTAAAAYHLLRKTQTLRGWACMENGPLRPLRINGRLYWKTDELRRLLGVTE